MNNKKYINCTDLSILELKIAYMLDLQIHKIPFYKKSMLRVENINERNKFFKYNNENNIFIKKVSYIKHKLNENEYEVDFDIFDKIIEILIQTNIYKYYENVIIQKKIYYNPIPQIYGFYHNISNIDTYGNIFNDLYIEMEEISGLRFDSFVNSKLFRCTEENSIKSLKDLINAYILICKILIPLQHELNFLHCDFKGSNILIGKDRRFRFIEFEYSYIKKDNYHIFCTSKKKNYRNKETIEFMINNFRKIQHNFRPSLV
jgi:thiamine kinase-like enzyme